MRLYVKEAFRNWRTSTMGVGALVYAVADLIVMLHDSTWDGNRLGTDILAILSGFGLISARDGRVSAEEHHEDRQDIRELKEEVK
jgi:hypothetical protein